MKNLVFFSTLTAGSLLWKSGAVFRRGRVRRAAETLGRKPDPRLAVYHQGGIGSGLMLAPMLAALRRAKPGCAIQLYSHQEQEGWFLKAGGLVDGFFVIPRAGRPAQMGGPAYDALLSAARTYDGARAAGGIRAKLKIGFHHPVGWHARSGLYQDITIPISYQEHEVQANMGLLAPFGDVPPVPPEVLSDDSPLFSGGPAPAVRAGVAFHPGGGKGLAWKRYPLERMIEAAVLIRKELGADIFAVAGPDETEEARVMADRLGQGSQVFRTTSSLVDTFNFLRTVRCLVTSDSMMMHLAAAAQCPQVTLIGPTNPYLSGPWCGPSLCRIVSHPLYCSPCYKLYSGLLNCINRHHLECLDVISPREILEAARSLCRE
ncbi:MAG: hypothetical protein A3D28_06240 [Omnitrophica bacterium RIFCSPHIGHO2_02_FULL_63_14]|nr:MAG: hypothetical protein A3D28_06240 [Omnitrophica bacterium RIFCSPHIGHO2_02_FULL_63_14]